MVKGISRQVILVKTPKPELFEQAIFILKEGTKPVTDEELLQEARKAIREGRPEKKRHFYLYGAVWAGAGAGLMGLFWLISAFL